jgi:WD40 repeat protein/DNA-binding SARP family transcriptional activator/class 3 adenylate cyclase/tRNA A-37 threonylcarbamoyl transferase component Bud32
MDRIRGDDTAWRARARGSILGRMRRAHADEDRSTELEEPTEAATAFVEPIRTFLIADVRGYTVFTQERGDEAAARLATRFADLVREHIEARSGSVVELRGDEALAVFGSPREAIRAAIDLERRFLTETIASPDLPLPVGIGLDVGEAVAVDGGYRGGALNLAARLCAEARPGEILVSQNVAHLARTIDGLRYADRGQLHFKGLSDPVRVVAVVSEDTDFAERMRALLPKEPRRRAFGGRMRFGMLGALEVDAGRGPIQLGGPKQRAVLAHLLLRANEHVSAETLVDEVWGEAPPDRARNIIQTYVSHLRKVLGRDRIETQASGYQLRLDPSELDVARFDELVRNAKKSSSVDPAIAVAALEEALALWRGPALGDLADQPSLVADASRLNELRLQAQEDRIEALLASGADARAIGDLEVLLAHQPLRERLWGFLILALYRQGRQGDALSAYQRAKKVLADELGIDPSPELARLQERVLRQDPGLELRGVPLRGYRLLEKIGEGATGVVFRAIQPHVERDVAVKIVHERIATDPDFVRRFEQESQAAAALEHPQIVPLYDYWREPGHAYIVSRYLRGGSLRALLERGEVLDRERVFRLLEQVALALAFAHRQEVAHGNVGSANVLFDGEGNAYLADLLVGTATRERDDDIRGLARLTREVLGKEIPSSLDAVVERSEGAEVPTAEEFAEAARAALEPAAEVSDRASDQRNPYKGLRAFTEADAHDFFGRGELTYRLVSRLREAGAGSRFLAVVGPSGCGKSSMVRAGLVPAVRRDGLGTADEPFVAEMFPGASPFEELEAALLRISVRPISLLRTRLESGSRGLLEAVDLIGSGDTEVLLVVDQFEELFTLTTDEQERELFLESLRVATADPESRLRVVITLRADFYDRPLVYPRFGELLASRTEAVPPLTPDELEQAIGSPAARVGVQPERGLVAEMIADVAHQPGALPLLQYALTELFDRRDEDRLTLSAYREIGGIAGALSARADRIYESAEPRTRRALKQVFLRLVTLGEGRPDTRRRVARSELDALAVDPAVIEGVVRTFGRHRLLTFDRDPSTRGPTVEIAHEALLTSWRRLRTWIDDARGDLRENERLVRAGMEWRASGHDPSFLLRGVRLEQVEDWASATDLAIATAEHRYLEASVEHREREQATERARVERETWVERRSRRRLRGLVALFAVAALVTGTLTIVATRQSQRAERQARLAEARELAAAAVANLDADPERSILLATEAVERTRSIDGLVLPEAEEALHRAVTSTRLIRWFDLSGAILDWSSRGVFVSFSYDNDGAIRIRDPESGDVVAAFRGPGATVTSARFSPDGARLATTSRDGRLVVWDVRTGRVVMMASGHGQARGASFATDGSIVAAAWPEAGIVRLFDASNGRKIQTFSDLDGAWSTAFDPQGRKVAVSTAHDNCDGGPWAVFEIDLGSGRRQMLERSKPCGSMFVTWSPDGRYIFANDHFWDGATGAFRFTLPPLHTDSISSAAWSFDGDRLATGSYDGSVRVWEMASGIPVSSLRFSAQDVYDVPAVTFSPDGSELMSTAGSGARHVRIWDARPGGGQEIANISSSVPDGWWWGSAGFVIGGRVAITDGERPLTLWDAETGERSGTIGPPFRSVDRWRSTPGFDVSADGRSVAISTGDGHVRVFDATTGDEVLDQPGPRWVDQFDLNPSGGFLAMTGWEKVGDRWAHRAQILDVGSGRVVAHLPDAKAVQFSPDDRTIALFTYEEGEVEPPFDRRVEFWDWRRGRTISSMSNGEDLRGLFDPTGTLFIAIGDRRQPRVWNVSTGRVVAEMPKQPGDLYGIALSPDGSRLAVGSADRSVTLFDVTSGRELMTLPGHGDVPAALAFSPDGSHLVAQTPFAGTRIWTLDIDELLGIAAEKVTRGFTAEECQAYLHLDRCPAGSARLAE